MSFLRLVPFFFLAFFSVTASADTLKSDTEAKQLAEQVMVQVAKENIADAFKLMKPYAIIPATEIDSVALQSKAQRDRLGTRYGKSIGYEYIGEKRVGESLLRLTYIEKTTKHAMPWVFYFYKSPSGWVMNSFSWNDTVDVVFQ